MKQDSKTWAEHRNRHFAELRLMQDDRFTADVLETIRMLLSGADSVRPDELDPRTRKLMKGRIKRLKRELLAFRERLTDSA